MIVKTDQLRFLVKVSFLSAKLLFCQSVSLWTFGIMGMFTCDKLAGRYCLLNSYLYSLHKTMISVASVFKFPQEVPLKLKLIQYKIIGITILLKYLPV